MRLDATRIAPKLWQGSKPVGPLRGFDAVAFCAAEHQPNVAGIEVYNCPLHDDVLSPEETSIALSCARRVASIVLSGRRVLVTCQQGRNRSGLVTALALHLLTGWPGWWCVRRVKSHRNPDLFRLGMGPALSNESFVAFLSRIPESCPEMPTCV
jgi:hypothetical protein